MAVDGAEAVEMWKVAELGSKKQESNNAQGQGEGEWQGPSGSKIDQAYALVLMDNVMPNMTGVQATQKIRALEAADFGGSGHSSSDSINSMWMSQPAMPPKRRTMIFGLTGNALSEDVAEFKSAGCDEVSQAVRRFPFIFNLDLLLFSCVLHFRVNELIRSWLICSFYFCQVLTKPLSMATFKVLLGYHGLLRDEAA